MPENSCICVYASPLRKRKPNPEHLEIHVVVGFCGLIGRKVQSRHKAAREFLEPRGPFLSANSDERRSIISNIIGGIETPFPLQDIYWTIGRFPEEGANTHTIEELIAGKLTDVSHDIASNKDYTTMEIYLVKHEKLDKPSSYPYLISEPLGDWVLENPGVEEGTKPEYLETILELRALWNGYCGVRSVKIGEEAAEDQCSICDRGFEKGKYEIRMPCSHVFHGSCILKWLKISPTCPYCSFKLFTREQRQCF